MIDTTAPVLVGVPADLTIECDEEAPGFQVYATDNCDDDIFFEESSETTYGCGETYTTVYTFYAEDDCGNSASATYTLTVVDTTAPVIDMPSVTQVDLTCEEFTCGLDALVAFENGDLTGQDAAAVRQCVQGLFMEYGLIPEGVTDNCDDVEWVENDFTVDILGCAPFGDLTNVKAVITCYFDATDDCGNEAEQTQTTITIYDTTAPLLEVAQSADVECGEPFDLVGYEAYDDCGMVDVAIDSAFTAACGNTGNWVITYTATDMCGNSTVATQNITIVDTTAPSITANPDATVECGEAFDLGGSSASDICGTVTVDVDSIFDGSCGNTGVWVLTYMATDECGNSAADQQVITIVDTTDPEFINPPANTTAECDDVPAPDAIETTDNCGDVEVDYSEILFSGGCEGTLERTWIITDECGNSNIHIQYINLIDVTAPVISANPDATVECGEEFDLVGYSVSDNCDDEVAVAIDSVFTGACGNTGNWVITYTATDNCFNSSVATQNITIIDTTAPYFDTLVEDAEADCQQIPAPAIVTASDACGSATVDMSEVSSLGCPYTITRTYVATDACGNTATQVQVITVVDTTAPTLSSYPENDEVECGNIPDAPVLTASDNCDDDVQVEFSEVNNPGGCVYTIIRTWTAEDACGNTVSHTQTITVVDTTAPYFDLSTVPADVTVECDAIPAPAAPTASDDCQGGATVTPFESETPGECDGEKTITRTWVANDGCGNTAAVSQTITVIDTTAPVFDEEPMDETYVCGDDIPAAPVLTATDNCSNNVSITLEADTVGNTNPFKDCALTTGVPISGPTWSMFFNLDGVLQYYILDEDGARFEEFADGTANITGTVFNPTAPERMWHIDMWLENKADYDAWVSQLTISAPFINRQPKDFLNLASQEDKESWEYYEVDATRAKLIGDGIFAGDTLNLSHAPASKLFGFQVGQHANGYNSVFGIGGWFFYSGTVLGEPKTGDGDLAFDADCPPCEYTITRIWTATDDCGNSSMTMQVINVTAPEATAPENSTVENFSTPESYGFVKAYPNPTADMAIVEYTVPVTGRVSIDVLDANGRSMDQVFEGLAYSGRNNIATFDGTTFEGGLYIVRMTSDNNVYFQKVMLQK